MTLQNIEVQIASCKILSMASVRNCGQWHNWPHLFMIGAQVDIVFHDFSKAFDKLPRHHLTVKVSNYDINGSTLEWEMIFCATEIRLF